MNDSGAMSCGLAAWGVVRIPWADIAVRRRNPGPSEGLHIGQLKLADEQTVVGMAAVLEACHRRGWAPTAFHEWSVLAAPKYLGRARLAAAFERYHKQGVRGVSPILIPTLSQHSVAGTISLILESHGPSFGVAGCSTPISEVLMNAMSVFDGLRIPGVWAIATAWNPEPIPDAAGQIASPTTGIGVALALTPQSAGGQVRLTIPDRVDRTASNRGTLPELADFLEAADSASGWRCGISGGGHLEIVPGTLAATAASTLRKAA